MKKLLLFLASCVLAVAPAMAIVGPQLTQVVMVKFADHPEEPCTPAWAGTVAFNQYGPWLQAESSGATWLVGDSVDNVVGWLVLPYDAAHYCTLTSTGAILSCNALQIASDAMMMTSINFQWYSQKLIWLIVNAFPGAVAGNPAVVSNCYPNSTSPTLQGIYTLMHEHGHVELSHAGSWWCPGGDVGELYASYLDIQGQGCTFLEYGDTLDPMGSPSINDPDPLAHLHFSSFSKSRQGWQAPGRSVTANETLTLLAGQEIRIPISDGFFYTLEYRPNLGVFIRIATSSPSYTVWKDFEMLVNFSSAADFYKWPPNSAITAANPFFDPYRKIGVQLASSPATVSIFFGDAPLPPPPLPPPPKPCHGRKCR